MRKWTDEELRVIADEAQRDVMEYATAEQVDAMTIITITADVLNIHDEDRDVFFHMMGVDATH